MKNLFFVAVSITVFSGATISLKAQTHSNAARFAGSAAPKTSLKFIETIEIIPAVAASITGIPSAEPEDGSVNALPGIKVKPVDMAGIESCSALQFKYATMMDREVESISNVNLYRFIEKWWATRYQYGGTDSSGIDCSAFTGKLLDEVYGISLPRTAREQYKFCEKLRTGDLTEGDLVFFNTRGGVSHVGLYLGDSYFVHSSVHSGVVISSLLDEYYGKKFISGGRIAQRANPAASEAIVSSVSKAAP